MAKTRLIGTLGAMAKLKAISCRTRAEDVKLLAELLAPSLGLRQAHRAAECALRACGNFAGLARMPASQLCQLPGWNRDSANIIGSARSLVQRQLECRLIRGQPLTRPEQAERYLRTSMAHRRREIFSCLFLDVQHRVVACEELFKGSIDGTSVYPRVVAERALLLGAAAVIVAHNHPSGTTDPSTADRAISGRLSKALALLDIRLLDHFIIGDGRAVSMARRGLL